MLVLAILAAATTLLTWQRQGASPPAGRIDDAPPLGYYIRGARILGTDERGRITYRIFAERLDETPDEERLQLTGVNVDYRPAEETAWSISAATAISPRDGSQLDLDGNVEIRSSPGDGSEPLTIFAGNLRFWPDTSSAESDGAVEIRVGDWRLQARGLRTHLKGDTLELESEVHGTLAP
jgi:LPS export ABC transporter protein LptC